MRSPSSRGFTILEVTFATGILFVAFVLVTGALAQLAGVREIGDRQALSVSCLEHCLDQLQRGTAPDALKPPEGLPGDYAITVQPLQDTPVPVHRVAVKTRTSRGREIVVSAISTMGESRHAP